MRLVDKIRQRLYQEQVKLTDSLAEIIGFKSSTDTESIIDKDTIPDKAKQWLIDQKETLIESFPRENTAKLRATNDMANIDQYAVLVMFKQLLRAQNSRLVSRKIYNWSTSLKRQQYSLEYRILTLQKIGRKRVSRFLAEKDTKKFKPTLDTVKETTTPVDEENKTSNTDTTPVDEENKMANTDTTPVNEENKTSDTGIPPPGEENKTANTGIPPPGEENKTSDTGIPTETVENKTANTGIPTETVEKITINTDTPKETVEENIDVSPKTSDTETSNSNTAPNTPPPSPISP